MSGRKAFADLTAPFTPARRAAVEARKGELRAAMSLTELRHARRLTQQGIAAALKVGQPAVAKLEKRTDMYVGTLRRHIEALGGELEVTARFPEGDVAITNFADLGAEGPVKA